MSEQKRWLLIHHESDCLYEALTEEDARQCLNEHQCDDVTDDEFWEAEWLKQKERVAIFRKEQEDDKNLLDQTR